MTAPPNILFLFSDQHRHDWTEDLVPVRTPHLAALARRGLRFRNAVTPAPLCAPARACLALGAEYGSNGPVLVNQADLPAAARGRTFYHRLAAAGYRVASVGKLDLNKKSHSWGADGKHTVDGESLFHAWGFTDGFDVEGKLPALRFAAAPKGPYGRFLKERGLDRIMVREAKRRLAGEAALYGVAEPTPLAPGAYLDDWIGGHGLELLERMHRDGRGPWFLQVNFAGPHPPLDPPAALLRGYDDVRLPGPQGAAAGPFDAAAHQRIRRAYAALVEHVDSWVGRFSGLIERLGIAGSTLVCYASDHGEMLGDHGLWKKKVPFQPAVGVPLLFAGPGVEAGSLRREPATLVDLAATFCDVAGARAAAFPHSRSLRASLASAAAPAARTVVESACGPWRLAFDGRFKLVTGYAAAAQLFDLKEDPAELVDVADRRPAELRRLQELMARP